MPALETVAKQKIIGDFQRQPGDTGSAEVQVAIITERIKLLTEHLRTHKNDKHSRRGLMNLVNQRRKLLNYLKRTERPRYDTVIKRLGIRH